MTDATGDTIDIVSGADVAGMTPISYVYEIFTGTIWKEADLNRGSRRLDSGHGTGTHYRDN